MRRNLKASTNTEIKFFSHTGRSSGIPDSVGAKGSSVTQSASAGGPSSSMPSTTPSPGAIASSPSTSTALGLMNNKRSPISPTPNAASSSAPISAIDQKLVTPGSTSPSRGRKTSNYVSEGSSVNLATSSGNSSRIGTSESKADAALEFPQISSTSIGNGRSKVTSRQIAEEIFSHELFKRMGQNENDGETKEERSSKNLKPMTLDLRPEELVYLSRIPGALLPDGGIDTSSTVAGRRLKIFGGVKNHAVRRLDTPQDSVRMPIFLRGGHSPSAANSNASGGAGFLPPLTANSGGGGGGVSFPSAPTAATSNQNVSGQRPISQKGRNHATDFGGGAPGDEGSSNSKAESDGRAATAGSNSVGLAQLSPLAPAPTTSVAPSPLGHKGSTSSIRLGNPSELLNSLAPSSPRTQQQQGENARKVHPTAKRKQSKALLSLAMREPARSRALQEGAFLALINLSRDEDTVVREDCATAFRNFLQGPTNTVAARLAIDLGILQTLTALVDTSQALGGGVTTTSLPGLKRQGTGHPAGEISMSIRNIRRDCAAAICSLTFHEGLEGTLVAQGAVKTLLTICRKAHFYGKASIIAVVALRNLTCVTSRYQKIEVICQALLTILLSTGDPQVLEHAVWALCNLSAVRSIQSRLVEEGALRALHHICRLKIVTNGVPSSALTPGLEDNPNFHIMLVPKLVAMTLRNLTHAKTLGKTLIEHRVLSVLAVLCTMSVVHDSPPQPPLSARDSREAANNSPSSSPSTALTSQTIAQQGILNLCATSLAHLSMDDGCEDIVNEPQCLPCLIGLSYTMNVVSRRLVALALRNLSVVTEDKKLLLKGGVLPVILRLSEDTDSEILRCCIGALAALATVSGIPQYLIKSKSLTAILSKAFPAKSFCLWPSRSQALPQGDWAAEEDIGERNTMHEDASSLMRQQIELTASHLAYNLSCYPDCCDYLIQTDYVIEGLVGILLFSSSNGKAAPNSPLSEASESLGNGGKSKHGGALRLDNRAEEGSGSSQHKGGETIVTTTQQYALHTLKNIAQNSQIPASFQVFEAVSTIVLRETEGPRGSPRSSARLRVPSPNGRPLSPPVSPSSPSSAETIIKMPLESPGPAGDKTKEQQGLPSTLLTARQQADSSWHSPGSKPSASTLTLINPTSSSLSSSTRPLLRGCAELLLVLNLGSEECLKLIERGVIVVLIRALSRSGDAQAKTHCASILLLCAKFPQCRSKVAVPGLINALNDMLRMKNETKAVRSGEGDKEAGGSPEKAYQTGDDEIVDKIPQRVTQLIYRLSCGDDTLRSELVSQGVVSTLLSLCRWHEELIRMVSAAAICNLAHCPALVPRLIQDGTVSSLMVLALAKSQSGSTYSIQTKRICAKALINLMTFVSRPLPSSKMNSSPEYSAPPLVADSSTATQKQEGESLADKCFSMILKEGVIWAFTSLANSEDISTKRLCAVAMSNISCYDESATAMLQTSTLKSLEELALKNDQALLRACARTVCNLLTFPNSTKLLIEAGSIHLLTKIVSQGSPLQGNDEEVMESTMEKEEHSTTVPESKDGNPQTGEDIVGVGTRLPVLKGHIGTSLEGESPHSNATPGKQKVVRSLTKVRNRRSTWSFEEGHGPLPIMPLGLLAPLASDPAVSQDSEKCQEGQSCSDQDPELVESCRIALLMLCINPASSRELLEHPSVIEPLINSSLSVSSPNARKWCAIALFHISWHENLRRVMVQQTILSSLWELCHTVEGIDAAGLCSHIFLNLSCERSDELKRTWVEGRIIEGAMTIFREFGHDPRILLILRDTFFNFSCTREIADHMVTVGVSDALFQISRASFSFLSAIALAHSESATVSSSENSSREGKTIGNAPKVPQQRTDSSISSTSRVTYYKSVKSSIRINNLFPFMQELSRSPSASNVSETHRRGSGGNVTGEGEGIVQEQESKDSTDWHRMSPSKGSAFALNLPALGQAIGLSLSPDQRPPRASFVVHTIEQETTIVTALAVCNLAQGRINSSKLVREGGGELLIAFAKAQDIRVGYETLIAATLRNLLTAPGNQQTLVDNGIISAILDLSKTAEPRVIDDCYNALEIISYNPKLRATLRSTEGAVASLISMDAHLELYRTKDRFTNIGVGSGAAVSAGSAGFKLVDGMNEGVTREVSIKEGHGISVDALIGSSTSRSAPGISEMDLLGSGVAGHAPHEAYASTKHSSKGIRGLSEHRLHAEGEEDSGGEEGSERAAVEEATGVSERNSRGSSIENSTHTIDKIPGLTFTSVTSGGGGNGGAGKDGSVSKRTALRGASMQFTLLNEAVSAMTASLHAPPDTFSPTVHHDSEPTSKIQYPGTARRPTHSTGGTYKASLSANPPLRRTLLSMIEEESWYNGARGSCSRPGPAEPVPPPPLRTSLQLSNDLAPKIEVHRCPVHCEKLEVLDLATEEMSTSLSSNAPTLPAGIERTEIHDSTFKDEGFPPTIMLQKIDIVEKMADLDAVHDLFIMREYEVRRASLLAKRSTTSGQEQTPPPLHQLMQSAQEVPGCTSTPSQQAMILHLSKELLSKRPGSPTHVGAARPSTSAPASSSPLSKLDPSPNLRKQKKSLHASLSPPPLTLKSAKLLEAVDGPRKSKGAPPAYSDDPKYNGAEQSQGEQHVNKAEAEVQQQGDSDDGSSQDSFDDEEPKEAKLAEFRKVLCTHFIDTTGV